MTNRTLFLTENIYHYLLSVSLRESEILQNLRNVTAQFNSHEMQIAPEQGQFLSLLVQLLGARKTLEIGVYTGYSALSVALALPMDGKIIACDINAEWTSIARVHWTQAGVENKIDLRIAPAIQTLDTLIAQGQSGTFDFAFIDADKMNYDSYYEKCMVLLRRGGLIAVDNTLWGGEVADPIINDKITCVLRKLNQKIHKDTRVNMSMVPIGDGLTLARKC